MDNLKRLVSGAFVGDIAVAADVTVNSKGGSMTATLKKALREKLGDLGEQLAGAALQFTTGQAIVLLSTAGGGVQAPIRVQRTGRNRFEIELEAGGDDEVDEVTAAFLSLKKQQFVSGDLKLMTPVTAQQLKAEADEQMAAAREAVATLTARSNKK